jgi:hypothetical protein
MDKQELDIWIDGCITYYNKKTNNNMATIEERIKQLEQAHGRTHNKQQELVEQLNKLNKDLSEQLTRITTQLKEIKQEVPDALPEQFLEDKKYTGQITEVISTKDVIWRKMNYTNWEIKLKGKDHIFLAFIKKDVILEPGMLVNFTYKHYLKLVHLKLVQ